MSGQSRYRRPRRQAKRIDLGHIASGPRAPNAHYIFPFNHGPDKYVVLISGDEDPYTGRDRILLATRLASGPASRTDGRFPSVPSTKRRGRAKQSAGMTGVQLMDAPPSWHRSARTLEYHVKYAHGFMFVFNMSSWETFELAREMLEAVMHTAVALGLAGGGPGSLPVVLVGNVDKNLCRREDDLRAQDAATTASVRAEAVMLAERWGCKFFEADTGSDVALSEGADEVVLMVMQGLEEANHNRRSGIGYEFSEVKAPQRLLVRRTMSRILPGALLKVFAE